MTGCAVSSSTVYRVLRESNLVCRWKPKEGAGDGPTSAADETRSALADGHPLHQGQGEELLLAELRRCVLAVRGASRVVDHDGRAERVRRCRGGDRDVAPGGAADDPKRSRLRLHRPGVCRHVGRVGRRAHADPPAHPRRTTGSSNATIARSERRSRSTNWKDSPRPRR